VKDRAFTGRDVAEAVRIAARTLGLSEAALRYFVLDPGRPGGLGISPSPARIAVLMDPASLEAATPPDEADDLPEEEGEDLVAHLQSVVRALGEAAGLELAAEFEEDSETARIRLVATDPGFLLGEDGGGDVLRAVEHLLHRMYALDVAPLKLKVELEGYREARDEALRRRALDLAATVKREGTPRETEPLNSYERRIVHLAVATAGGVVSRSVGEGKDRRVTIAQAPPEDGPGDEVF
jgi:spoIIIJ-associated protein